MAAFYEGFLGLQFQGEVEFPGGSQAAVLVGSGVSSSSRSSRRPPRRCPGGGRAQGGIRYFTIGVTNLRAVAEAFGDSEYEWFEPVTEFAPVPGMGWDVRATRRQLDRTVRNAVSVPNTPQQRRPVTASRIAFADLPRCTRCNRPICPECMRDRPSVTSARVRCATGRTTVRQPRTALGDRNDGPLPSSPTA